MLERVLEIAQTILGPALLKDVLGVQMSGVCLLCAAAAGGHDPRAVDRNAELDGALGLRSSDPTFATHADFSALLRELHLLRHP